MWSLRGLFSNDTDIFHQKPSRYMCMRFADLLSSLLGFLKLAVKLKDLKHELKSMLTHKAVVFLPVQTIWEEDFLLQNVQINTNISCYIWC